MLKANSLKNISLSPGTKGGEQHFVRKIFKNTQKAIKGAIAQFEVYLDLKKIIGETPVLHALFNFYIEVKQQKAVNYAV